MLRENVPFRRLLFGRIVTNVGDSFYIIAAMWFVHELTGSAAFTGIAGFLFRFPRALQFLTGPVVDRISLRPLLVATQLIQGVLILVIPAAAALDLLSVWLVLAVIPLLAMVNQFVYPAQSAALPRLVTQENIPAANSMFSFAYRGIDLIANAVGGGVIAVTGALLLFKFNSVTFFVAAALFARVAIPAQDDDESAAEPTADDESTESTADDGHLEQYAAELRDGFGYIRDSLLKYIVVSSAIVNFSLGVTFAVLPKYADSIGGAGVYGLLMAAMAAGSLTGAVVAPRLKQYPYGLVQTALFVPGTVLWVASIRLGGVPTTVGLFALAWIPVGVFNVMTHSVLQISSPDDMIGRVTSAAVSASAVASPVGALAGGAIAEAIGGGTTLIAAGVGYLAISLIFGGVADLRRMPSLADIDTADVFAEGS